MAVVSTSITVDRVIKVSFFGRLAPLHRQRWLRDAQVSSRTNNASTCFRPRPNTGDFQLLLNISMPRRASTRHCLVA